MGFQENWNLWDLILCIVLRGKLKALFRMVRLGSKCVILIISLVEYTRQVVPLR